MLSSFHGAMFLRLLLLLSLFQAAFSHGILTLHFYSVGLDLSRIDCVLPFPRSPFNDVQPIRTEHDCEIYVRACLLDANYVGDSREPQSCGRTESFPFTRTFTGGISFPIWNVTTSSMVTIQFRSPDFPLDNYLYQNHQYDINRVRSGNDITNKTLKSRNFRGFVRGIIDCGEGYDLEFTKYSCVPNPASVDPFRAVRVIESGNRVESSTVTEKEDISPIAVTNPAPALVNQQRHAIYCDSPDCGSSIIFFIMGFSIFMFGLSLTVCYFVLRLNGLAIPPVVSTSQPPPSPPFAPAPLSVPPFAIVQYEREPRRVTVIATNRIHSDETSLEIDIVPADP